MTLRPNYYTPYLQGAYNAIYRLLTTIPTNYVEPISQMHLKIASMGKARLARGYPSPNKLVLEGVPKGLANALAPFQRGGVDFAIDKQGRALIADGTFTVYFYAGIHSLPFATL